MKRPFIRTAVAALAVAGLPAAPAFASTVCPYDLCVTNVNDSGAGSLRQAILDANVASDKQTIGFTLTGSGNHMIKPGSNLPAITQPVVIDGYTQSGSAPATSTTPATPTITINATNATTGLVLNADDSTISGLVVNRVGTTTGGGNCTGVGICVRGDDDVISGNYVGVGRLGDVAEPNSAQGIKVLGSRTVLGGTDIADRNVVSGNTLDGILLAPASDHTTIQNNLIGTTDDGLGRVDNQRHGIWINGSFNNQVGTNGAGNTISGNKDDGVRVDGDDDVLTLSNTIAANRIGLTVVPGWTGLGGMPNVGDGIAVFAHNVIIGGDLPGDGNSIATNGRNGILLGEGTTFSIVHGNFIGTDPAGSGGLGNALDGVAIRDASSNAIGSSDPAVPPNVITSNRRGVYVVGDNAIDNPILGNSIDLNPGSAGTDGLGIDLDPSGVTGNDMGDTDGGPNLTQNYPEYVLQFVNGAGTPVIRWSLDSTAMTRFRIEVFAGPACDPSGSGEGATLLSATVVRDVAGVVVFDTPVPVPSGTAITTTATPVGAYEGTSEFSQCVVVA